MSNKSKRRVPAALHHELSEYAALLRALRTRDAMDLTKHLTKPSPFALNDTSVSVSTSASSSRTGTPMPYAEFTEGKACEASKKQKPRNHWTRWPLLLDDVRKPEWTLEDEVAVIANQVFKLRPPPYPMFSTDSPVSDDPEDDGDPDFVYVNNMIEEDDPDHAFYVPHLASIIDQYLRTILAQLASSTPARPGSMQNRIEPLNWRAVIDTVVCCGNREFANPKVVENVIRRMEEIYGPSISPVESKTSTSRRPVERIHAQTAATERFNQSLEKAEAELFTSKLLPTYRPSSPPSPPIFKQKPNSKRRKEEAEFVLRKSKNKTTLPEAETSMPAELEGEQSEETLKPRRSGRIKSQVNYRDVPLNVSAMEE